MLERPLLIMLISYESYDTSSKKHTIILKGTFVFFKGNFLKENIIEKERY